jgi:2-polyprenyl-6-methoxyphenol hydroxylase-like FAD-dependent oxidoreductase
MARSTQCCIAGGGPAGVMLGFLLARSGIDVIVLEKHGDFFRDFRGDTVHPSTLEIVYELGLLDEFLKLPHQEAPRLEGRIGASTITVADFSHVPTRCKFIALMPQWDFLNFMSDHAKRYPSFHLEMNAEVDDLLVENGRVAGVRAQTPSGPLEIRANLIVGADGRSSTVREKANLEVEDFGAPIDVLWMRVSRRPSDPDMTFGRIDAGKILVMINRGDYWQCAFVIRKGGFSDVQARGLPAFRATLRELAPYLEDRPDELGDWDDIKLLTVKVDRLRRWYRPGLLCIGDAAHAMSPIGGVGINLAIQDAVAAANILAGHFGQTPMDEAPLAAVQRRREWPARMTQRIQVFVQNRIMSRILDSAQAMTPPLPVRLLQAVPLLRAIPAYVVGIGFRPEHVHSPDVLRSPAGAKPMAS